MSTSRKRPASPSPNERITKYAREEPIVISDDEDDYMNTILARIKEQDESEALAKRLQDEWNNNTNDDPVSSLPVAGSSRWQDEDVITVNSDSEGEDDGAMAKRLAKEWGEILPDDDIAFVSSNVMPALHSHSLEAAVKGKAPNRSPINDEPSPDQKLRQCSDVFLAERNCSNCAAVFKSPRGHVMFSNYNPPPSLVHLLHAPCRRCNTNHCRGCMTPILCPIGCKGPEKNPQCTVEECCARVRAIALFEALGGFDRQFLGEKASSAERARAASAKAKTQKVNTVGPGGTGYSTNDPYNYSYGNWHGRGGRGEGSGRRRGRARGASNFDSGSTSSYTNNIAAHWEEVVTRAFTTFTKYLPDPYSDTAQIYDMIPHESIQSLLALSQLPELLGSLLRNDSVTDWITRSDTYHAMLRLLRRMADCELTVEVLISDGWEKSSSCGLQEWMWQDGEIRWELDDKGQITRTAPLYNHFKKLTRQCEAFLGGASQLMDGDENTDGEVDEMAMKGTSLCGDIIAARDDMDRLFQALGKINAGDDLNDDTIPNNSKGKGKDPSLEMDRIYARDCERLAFHHISMSEVDGNSLIYKAFHYSDMVKGTANQTRIPKDRLHLVKELAATSTSLPPGVWVRVDEVRNDVIKIMIAGPEETPYSGGLFEFDCFLPINYPNSPPLLHLRTTGGGKVRFNPNLYNNGKVCLSLLGTWAGRPEEEWQPRKSTLLQVIVSVQSMILIESPYFNEPGCGQADPKDHRSINYNREIRLQTVRWAIVEWMKDKYKHSIWADVIASHFRIRNDKVRKSIHEWAGQDPRFRKYTAQTATTMGLSMASQPWDSDEEDMSLETMPYHPSSTRRGVPKSKISVSGQDLLAEYDIGIQRINKWSQITQGT